MFRHIFVIVFLITLIIIVISGINKQILHFKLLKEIYPSHLSKINSYFNPLAIFYLFRLKISIIFWFSIPLYYRKMNIIIENNRVITLEKKLFSNNKRIYMSLIILFIWILFGVIYFQ